MPAGELNINGYDAYTTWGVSLDMTGLSALMTPPGNKAVVENETRLEHGRRYINTTPRMASREVTLTINMSAPSESVFLTRYAAFCQQLATGELVICTKYQPNVHYHFLYRSCQQFTELQRGVAKFVLKLTEPNPGMRSVPAIPSQS